MHDVGLDTFTHEGKQPLADMGARRTPSSRDALARHGERSANEVLLQQLVESPVPQEMRNGRAITRDRPVMIDQHE
jgi:hypothetical protein